MMVSLALAALIIGAVMGLISESLRHKANLKEKARIQPILESAAQIILADPAKAMLGSVRLDEFEGAPVVGVFLSPVQLEDTGLGENAGQLCRVMLGYKTGRLEFSVIIPGKDLK
jgi:hypothetical protein